MNIREAGSLLRARKISCVELVQESLKSIDRDQALNAFITVTGDQALAEAAQRDRELGAGQDRGPLHGIPIALKDLYYTAGVRTTNGSRLFENFVPDHDGTVVSKLKDAGAISVGKLNQHELAYGITSNNPHFGSVRNPHDPERIPGGSSGGSGVAVATGAVFCGMGSDTGGSIRNPAAFCGVVGIKPTFGLVSRHGCFQLGLSLDTMGPLARSVGDCALVMNAIAGRDGRDEGSVERPPEDFEPEKNASLKGVRLGRPENFYGDRLHEEVARAYHAAFDIAERLGARIIPVRVPDPEGLVTVARTVLLAEAAAVLEPYWDRRDDIGSDVRALIDQGRQLSASDYINVQRVRRSLIREWVRMFRDIDVLLTPAAPVPAPRIGQATVDIAGTPEDTRLAATRFVRGINALGLPAISIPCGTAEGLPVGLQLVGRAWGERQLLAYAAAFEAALPRYFPSQISNV